MRATGLVDHLSLLIFLLACIVVVPRLAIATILLVKDLCPEFRPDLGAASSTDQPSYHHQQCHNERRQPRTQVRQLLQIPQLIPQLPPSHLIAATRQPISTTLGPVAQTSAVGLEPATASHAASPDTSVTLAARALNGGSSNSTDSRSVKAP